MLKKYMALIIVLVFIVTGCMAQPENEPNQSNQSNQSQSNQSNQSHPSSQPNENAAANEKIEIEDGFGTQTFDGVQSRIVALEWSIVEEMLITGVQPVGVADIENFNKWVTIDAELSGDVVDVGGRIEPNLEMISQLNPDVIIGIKGRHEKIKAELEKIAPVIMYDNTTDKAQENLYAHMMNTLQQTAKLVGKEKEAEEAIQRLESRYADAKSQIDNLGLTTNEFVFTQAFSVNQAPTFRLFTKNSIVSNVLENMGLVNKIQDEAEGASGMIETNVEGVSKYQEAMLLHTVQEDDPLFDNLANNAAWQGLYFVKEEEMYDVGAGVWTFGSVLSMETLVEHVVEALVK